MRRVYIPLAETEIDALVRLARAQRRRPQDQAALIITEALSSSGALEVEQIHLTKATRETVIA